MAVATRTLTVTERDGGWQYGDSLYATAAEAMRAIKAGSRGVAEVTGETDVCIVHWWPTTRVGRMVVECLTANRPTRIRSRKGSSGRETAHPDESTCRECGIELKAGDDGYGTGSGLCKRHTE
jgi:hypothetical protein